MVSDFVNTVAGVRGNDVSIPPYPYPLDLSLEVSILPCHAMPCHSIFPVPMPRRLHLFIVLSPLTPTHAGAAAGGEVERLLASRSFEGGHQQLEACLPGRGECRLSCRSNLVRIVLVRLADLCACTVHLAH